jgi:hypothetical protein
VSAGGYTKLYASILDSSVWSESHATVRVWIAMLAMADQDGHVEASLGGLARRANVTREECEQALSVLAGPDLDDKSGVDDGRRVRKVERGWSITNHRRYREMRTKKQIQTAQRVRKHRVTRVTGNAVTQDSAPSASASAFASISEGGVGETLSAADLRRPMTAAWKPALETLASFEVAMIPEWAVAQIVPRFRAHFASNAQDLSTDAEWNQRCSKWVFGDWGNPAKRPKQPAAKDNGAAQRSSDAYKARVEAEAQEHHAAAAAANGDATTDDDNLTEGIG